MIPVYKPYFPKGSLDYAHDALESSWVSSKGPYLEELKDRLEEFWRTKYIILTNSGTAANHLMRIALEAKYVDRRTIFAPNNVYVAAWNPFLFDDTFRIEFFDANIDTWNMDLNNIIFPEHWSSIVLIVHNLGNIVNVPAFREKYPKAIVVEDNCEGFGGSYQNLESGTASDIFTVSFFGNKNVTSGEGGAFVTYDKELYEIAYRYWGQGVSIGNHKKFIHDDIGHNYRMTNVEAAILLGQLDNWTEIMLQKAVIWDRYYEAFSEINGLVLQKKDNDTIPSHWMYGIRVLGQDSYETANKFFSERGIETRPMFYPMNYHGHLKRFGGKIQVAELLAKEVVVLPSFPGLTEEEQNHIIKAVKDYVR